ncbi:hypothetical protein ACLOJK_015812 [Asimina triloba]
MTADYGGKDGRVENDFREELGLGSGCIIREEKTEEKLRRKTTEKGEIPKKGAKKMNQMPIPTTKNKAGRQLSSSVSLALEEVKFLQKQRERKSGIPAFPTVQAAVGGLAPKAGEKGEVGDGEKDDLVLQDTFAQETAVTIEDPNMLKYVEQELAKKRGKNINSANQAENDLKSAEDELYAIPEHLKVKKRNSEESSTQWTTGIAEVQLPIEFKLKNIEETEAAKKLLQEKRLAGRTKTELSIPSSYSADFFQRGRDYAERLRREHPELYKDRAIQDNSGGPKSSDTTNPEAAGRRQAATDEFMLERFRKRERNRDNLLLLLRALNVCFKAVVFASLLSCLIILAVMLCLPVLEVIWYFSPLLFSAGMCFTAICLFMALDDFQGDEFLLTQGARDVKWRQVELTTDNAECRIDIDVDEVGSLQVVNLNSQMIKGGWEEHERDCLVKKLGYEEEEGEGEGGYLSEKLGIENQVFFGDDDETSLQIDRLAEGLWDCFFGRYSRWNYKELDMHGW